MVLKRVDGEAAGRGGRGLARETFPSLNITMLCTYKCILLNYYFPKVWFSIGICFHFIKK